MIAVVGTKLLTEQQLLVSDWKPLRSPEFLFKTVKDFEPKFHDSGTIFSPDLCARLELSVAFELFEFQQTSVALHQVF